MGSGPGSGASLARRSATPHFPQGAAHNKMRRFLRPGHDPARERLKRDLFQFNKVRGAGGRRPCMDGGVWMAA